jgi:hypothetical protein
MRSKKLVLLKTYACSIITLLPFLYVPGYACSRYRYTSKIPVPTPRISGKIFSNKVQVDPHWSKCESG